MRLNASERSDYPLAMKTKITSNGVDIKYCLWFDTELGIAECAYAIASGWDTENEYLKTHPLYTHDGNGDIITLTYYLHNFEVWQDDKLIAKV